MSHAAVPKPLTALKSGPLTGVVRVPGDKSISHRALMFGAMATGRTRITGLLEAEDVVNTAKAVTALGCPAAKTGDIWEVLGRGIGGFRQPSGDLDFGNSGTGCRLMMGLIAGHDIAVRMIGDASLSRRPMRRVLGPLKQMGQSFLCRNVKVFILVRFINSGYSSHLHPYKTNDCEQSSCDSSNCKFIFTSAKHMPKKANNSKTNCKTAGYN